MLPFVVPKGNFRAWLPAPVTGALTRIRQQLVARAAPAPQATAPVLQTPPASRGAGPLQRPSLAQLARPDAVLPTFVAESAVARRYLDLLGPLDWTHFPERPTDHPWPGGAPAPRAPYVAAYLIKLNEGKRYMSDLRSYLVEHPALVWLSGFPLVPDPAAPHGFDVEASLPDRRQLGRVLRELPNPAAQFLLDGTVHLIRQALPADLDFGDVIALDTKHILAWVKENNPKAYIEHRYDKTQPPTGDRDCKLGCKKRHNKGEGNGPADSAHEPAPTPPPASAAASAAPPPDTPTTNPLPASQAVSVGEFYWGYASGVVSTKVPGWGEFVLAELTQTFDKGDATYFFPLMTQVERRLGRKPHFGARDKAYDAFYVYPYFHEAAASPPCP